MKDNPLVSVLTPVFNGASYLEICIQSVLNQSYPNIEHVFADGCSTDGTLDIIKSYQTRYPGRIRFISEPDTGSCDAWNKCFKMAKGDIFGWLGADDLYEPDAVMTAVEFFHSNPEARFVCGTCNVINEKGTVLWKYPVKEFDLRDALNDCINYLPFPAALYEREVIDKVGLMDTTINACDFDFLIKVGKAFRIYRMDKVLACFRIHEASVSGNKGIERVYRREHFKIIRRHGWRLFSPYSVRYFTLEAIDILRPVLRPIYPFAYRVYDASRKRIKPFDALLEKFFPRRV